MVKIPWYGKNAMVKKSTANYVTNTMLKNTMLKNMVKIPWYNNKNTMLKKHGDPR